MVCRLAGWDLNPMLSGDFSRVSIFFEKYASRLCPNGKAEHIALTVCY